MSDIWCEKCNSYHPRPTSREHHKALKCFADYKPEKKEEKKSEGYFDVDWKYRD